MSNPLYLDFAVTVYIAAPAPPVKAKKKATPPPPTPSFVTDKRAAEKAGLTVRYELATRGRKQFQYATPEGWYFEGVLDPLTEADVIKLVEMGAAARPATVAVNTRAADTPATTAAPEKTEKTARITRTVTVTFSVTHDMGEGAEATLRSMDPSTAWRRLRDAAVDVQTEKLTIE